MSNYSTLKAAISAVIKENNNHEITGQVLQTTLLAMVDSLADGYLFKGVATPATVVGTPDENVFYIGGAGTYSNFGATPVNVPDCCIGIFTYNGSFENHIIPTGGVFDISAYNAVGGTPATYEDLTAALGTGGANIPDYLRKGGMSVKFIQGNAPSSDNKYVQFFCTADEFTTDVTKWQGVDDSLVAGSENLAKGAAIFNSIITHSLSLTGTGNVLSKSGEIKVISAHIYRFYIKNVNIDMTGVSSGYRFVISKESAFSNPFFSVLVGTALESYYDIQMPSDAASVYIGVKCATDIPFVIYIKDITEIVDAEKKAEKNNIISLVGNGVVNTRFWKLDYKLEKDVEYKFKYISGDKGVITTDGETGPEVIEGQWVSFTPSANGNLYLRIPAGTTAVSAPNILMTHGASGISKELVEHYQEMDVLNDINKAIYGEKPTSISIPVTSGTNSYSNNNVYNGTTLPKGSVVKIKVLEAQSLISKIKLVVNNTYHAILAYSDFTDGQVFEIMLEEDVTSIGLYIDSSYVIGTGSVKLELNTNYQDTIDYKANHPKIDSELVLADVLFATDSSLMTVGAVTDTIKMAIKSARVWGLSHGNTVGISFVSKSGTGQLFFNVFDENGEGHGFYYNFNVSVINPDGLTYFAIYKEDLRFYPSYADDSILPSEIRLAIDFSKISGSTIGNYDASVCFAQFAPVICFDYPNPYTVIQNGATEVIYITCKRTGTSGVDADFCGLNAIGDAANSITDASENKKYVILIDGHFLFTDPKMVSAGGDFKYVETGEPTVLIAKDNVSFRGIGADRAVIEVNLDASLTETDFPYSDYFGRYLTWMDYQPMYITRNADIQNLTVIGRNCRYTVHIELNSDKGKDISLRNCVFIKKTGTKGSISCLTMGEIPYFNMLVDNCTFINEMGQTLIGGHTPLEYISDGHENCNVRFRNCNFRTAGQLTLSTYHYNRKDLHIFENCKFHPLVEIETAANASSKRPLDTLTDRKITGNAMPYSVDGKSACGLRVKTITGASSSVRFDPTCSAFGVIGNKNDNTAYESAYSAIKTYGYEYKDDTEGNNAYACGWVNIDPTTGNSLGAILGDCSGTSKTLKVTINGTEYSIVFNTNLTNASNADIIALINNVIGSVAICDTYNPEVQQYPDFDGEEYGVNNADNSVIEQGMGIIKTSANNIRKAKASDGYIDGIAIDTIYPSQKGRIITKGMLYNRTNTGTVIYYSITPVLTLTDFGTKISIDENNDGKFKVSSAAPVLKYVGENKVEIL